ncbi:hypothetical protein [Butyrivibrio sp. MC2013]|uniref:hypothetical protein n=1 Tax=Butyrivibrio sp. MC2013 TaxID=1280686 RepID=UPI00040C3D15|nr:hypothetical protein [Butyrivibrio sp. MC2013]
MNKRISLNMPIGAVSILLIFLAVSLISFALLSLQSALAEEALSSKASANTRSYYSAVLASEGFMADTDAALHQIYNSASDKNDYMQKAGSVILKEDFPISDCRYLHVELSPVYPDSNTDLCYSISVYNTVTDDSALGYDEGHIPLE